MSGTVIERNKRRANGRSAGFSLVELLIVLAIIGVMVGIIVMSGRPIARGQDIAAAVRTMQQSVWQGATMAASRGVRTRLVLSGRILEVRNDATNALIRRFELPEGASLNTSNNPLLVFTPPGKVDLTTLNALPSNLAITVAGRTHLLQISLIGEVRATPQ